MGLASGPSLHLPWGLFRFAKHCKNSPSGHCSYLLALNIQIMSQFQFGPESSKRILPYQHLVDKFLQDYCYFSGLSRGMVVYYSCSSLIPINNNHVHVIYREQTLY